MMNIQDRPYFHNVIREDHLIAPFDDNREDAEWIGGIDPGWSSPCAVVLGKCDGTGRLHITYAETLVQTGYAEIRDLIDERTSAGCEWLGVDPSMRAHDQQTGLSGLEWWRANRFLPKVYPVAVRGRLSLCRRWLAQDSFQGGITICHEAAPLHEALTRYAIEFPPEDVSRMLGEQGPTRAQCLTPNQSHLVDAFSYLLLRYTDLLASKAFGEHGLPVGHSVA